MKPDDIIFLNSGNNGKVVKLGDIMSIQVIGGNLLKVKLAYQGGAIVVRGSLAKCMRKLPDCFFAASRGHLINLTHVEKVNAAVRNIEFTMKDGESIIGSRLQGILFRKRFTL